MSSAKTLHAALQGMTIRQQRRLSDVSGVPFRTLYKIKRGFTVDPKSSTVDALMAGLRALSSDALYEQAQKSTAVKSHLHVGHS